MQLPGACGLAGAHSGDPGSSDGATTHTRLSVACSAPAATEVPGQGDLPGREAGGPLSPAHRVRRCRRRPCPHLAQSRVPGVGCTLVPSPIGRRRDQTRRLKPNLQEAICGADSQNHVWKMSDDFVIPPPNSASRGSPQRERCMTQATRPSSALRTDVPRGNPGAPPPESPPLGRPRKVPPWDPGSVHPTSPLPVPPAVPAGSPPGGPRGLALPPAVLCGPGQTRQPRAGWRGPAADTGRIGATISGAQKGVPARLPERGDVCPRRGCGAPVPQLGKASHLAQLPPIVSPSALASCPWGLRRSALGLPCPVSGPPSPAAPADAGGHSRGIEHAEDAGGRPGHHQPQVGTPTARNQ